MSEVASAGPVLAGPLEEYRRRLLAREGRESGLKSQHLWIGALRLGTVVGFLLVAWFTVFLKDGPQWTVLVPIVLFVVLGVWMGRVSRRLSRARRAAEMYRLGIARIEDRWVGLQEREVPGALSAHGAPGCARSWLLVCMPAIWIL